MTRHIGGSILPSASREVYETKQGKHGSFQTRPVAELDTHGLFFARNEGEFAGVYILIASHPNGYSCDHLAKRILEAWEPQDPRSVGRALEQFDYILSCGGMGKSRTAIEYITKGEF